MASRNIPYILKNFDLPDDLGGNFKVKCRYCHKDISGCMGSTSNFIIHIKRNHLLNGGMSSISREAFGMQYI